MLLASLLKERDVFAVDFANLWFFSIFWILRFSMNIVSYLSAYLIKTLCSKSRCRGLAQMIVTI